MFLLTTPAPADIKIKAIKGLASAQVVVGTNAVKDVFARVRDFVGGRVGTYEDTMQSAFDAAQIELCEKAAALGGNGIIGVQVQYMAIGRSESILCCLMSGTVVVAE